MTIRRPTDRQSGLVAAAAVFAAAELGAGLLIGRFFDWGRAEALVFFAFRPWLVLVGTLVASGWTWRRRWTFYALALLLAALAESLFLGQLGGQPWREAGRGLAAGLMAAAVADLLIQAGRRLAGRRGVAVAAVLLVLLLLVPGSLYLHDRVAIGPSRPRPAEGRPPLTLMTGLPLVWGETGAFDPASRPAAAFRYLQREFDVRPIDRLDPESLPDGTALLLAQPRLLEPSELVALDAWVRRGGRALILVDPRLTWPTELPLGDFRRPPGAHRLSPLLGHWRLGLEGVEPPSRVVHEVTQQGRRRRLILETPGRFSVGSGGCRAEMSGLVVRCAIGRGRVLLIADADLLRDELWAGAGDVPAARHRRLADNPLVVAGWIDALEGRERRRAARPVHWLDGKANGAAAVAAGLIPILSSLVLVLLLRRRRG